MSLGAPSLAAVGSPSSAWQYGGTFGVQPSGPHANVGGRGVHTLAGVEHVASSRGFTFPSVGPRVAGQAFGTITPGGAATGRRSGGILPSSDGLDYAHKLTQTTLLLGALIAFLIFHRGNYKRAFRSIASRHVGEV